jgi:hypothetical protein
MIWMMRSGNHLKRSRSIERNLNHSYLIVGAQWMIGIHNEEYLQQVDYRGILSIFSWESSNISRPTACPTHYPFVNSFWSDAHSLMCFCALRHFASSSMLLGAIRHRHEPISRYGCKSSRQSGTGMVQRLPQIHERKYPSVQAVFQQIKFIMVPAGQIVS